MAAKHVTRGALTFLGKLKVERMNHKVTTPPPHFLSTQSYTKYRNHVAHELPFLRGKVPRCRLARHGQRPTSR
jgi:hypothetical protein